MRGLLITMVSMLALGALVLSDGRALSGAERLTTAVFLALFIVGLLTRVAGPDADGPGLSASRRERTPAVVRSPRGRQPEGRSTPH